MMIHQRTYTMSRKKTVWYYLIPFVVAGAGVLLSKWLGVSTAQTLAVVIVVGVCYLVGYFEGRLA